VHVSLKAGPQPGDPERVEPQGTARVAEAAARAGLERITYLSGCYVGSEHTRDSEAETAKLGAERAIEASGVPFTIFKPTYFMETLPLHVQGPFGMVLGRQPHPLRMVAADDYARMVSAALRTPESSGLHLYVFGPEPLTISEALRIYLFMGGAMSRELGLMTVMQRLGEPTDVLDAGAVLGAATTTVRAWCERRSAQEHATRWNGLGSR
jgi:uncharacterized protein YbjT (DUF2867 family)